MNPVKKYKNISFNELIQFSLQNPNRNLLLDSIEIQTNLLPTETTLDIIFLPEHIIYHIQPIGILSLFAFITDPSLYFISNPSTRSPYTMELCTQLQIDTDLLKNTSIARKRKKLYDLLGSAYNNPQLSEKDYYDLFNLFSIIRRVHFLILKTTSMVDIEDPLLLSQSLNNKGDIIFSSNPTDWKEDEPVWIVDYQARWVAYSPIEKIKPHTWLHKMEELGWIIKWHEYSFTKTEFINKLYVLPNWQETDRKHSKDILSFRYSKQITLQHFQNMIK